VTSFNSCTIKVVKIGTNRKPVCNILFVINSNLSRFNVVVVGLDQRSYSTLGPVSAWVGDRGRVNHLSAEPGTQAYSARARPLWGQARMSTWRKLGK